MPVRWTAENDQLLLIKILEVHNELSVDVEGIARAWPAGNGNPTPRALKERLAKIRDNARKNGTISANGGFLIRNGNAPSSNSSTPTRGTRTPRGRRTNGSTRGSSTKRKRDGGQAQGGKEVANDDDEEGQPIVPYDTASTTVDSSGDDGEEGLQAAPTDSASITANTSGDEEQPAVHEHNEVKEEYEGPVDFENLEMEGTPSKKAKIEEPITALDEPKEEIKEDTTGWFEAYKTEE